MRNKKALATAGAFLCPLDFELNLDAGMRQEYRTLISPLIESIYEEGEQPL
jgi:hypothetical protein